MHHDQLEPRAVMGAADSSALKIAWNDERLDSMLANLTSLKPIARTGIDRLDDLLGGGICSGVHVVSAPPACGKSTLCLQIGDYFARYSKRRVIYVSCEMSAASLLAKSLVRLTAELSPSSPIRQSDMLSTIASLGSADSPRARLLLEAIDAYRGEIAPNFATVTQACSVEGVASLLRSCAVGDLAPIVIVDYLQLLKADGCDQGSGYEVITDLMRSICDLAREYATAVICISSQNRSSKRGSADFTALSGSSEIEYGATTAWFLTGKDDDHRHGDGRTVTLTVSKNRFGATGDVPLEFRPSEARFVCPQDRTS